MIYTHTTTSGPAGDPSDIIARTYTTDIPDDMAEMAEDLCEGYGELVSRDTKDDGSLTLTYRRLWRERPQDGPEVIRDMETREVIRLLPETPRNLAAVQALGYQPA